MFEFVLAVESRWWPGKRASGAAGRTQCLSKQGQLSSRVQRASPQNGGRLGTSRATRVHAGPNRHGEAEGIPLRSLYTELCKCASPHAAFFMAESSQPADWLPHQAAWVRRSAAIRELRPWAAFPYFETRFEPGMRGAQKPRRLFDRMLKIFSSNRRYSLQPGLILSIHLPRGTCRAVLPLGP